MAKVFLVYGERGAGKTTTTLKLAEALTERGIRVGGYFQRTTFDEEERRGYDLVRVSDRGQSLPLARPGGVEKPGTSTVCSFSFSQAGFQASTEWLRQDAEWAQVLVIDEISKLEVRAEGHAQALRWALELGDDRLLLLSVRGDQLYYVTEAFDLAEENIKGYLEIPADEAAVNEKAEDIAAGLILSTNSRT